MGMNVEKVMQPAFLGAFLVPSFEFLYGQGNIVLYLMLALIFFIALDWISGSRASKKDNSYASEYGIDGVFRSFFMLALPAGGHLLDMAFNLPPVLFGLLAAGLLYHTIQSSTANAIRAGWGRWIPDWIMTKIADWVKSEIESKLDRALKRKEAKDREGTA